MSNKTLQLYRQLIRESKKFKSYNFKEYSIRRVSLGFRENKNVKNSEELDKLYKSAEENLQMLKRQTLINSMYAHNKLVVEQ
ncbi:LYR motif-containing protein 4 [Tieghemostelium lacteum]|uniref:LYR motif-containing protein 4 n=1 Tax=Tieghemostelium lacteum TaxID=361077 RepID=A0A151Z9H7_TIELA|nr:LYR motif-containing protein 4 [Tieghemostelium lacteum]|eukprot:KYQ90595.1 LYR motif-containing protein 4 [Tieghemostelium lacteum]